MTTRDTAMPRWTYHVGFTGSRDGMNAAQMMHLRQELEDLHLAEFLTFHHGDCQGADDQAARMAHSMGFWIVSHPPISPRYRAFSESHEIRDQFDYLERDRHIVAESHFMIAAPGTMHEVLRSGTWATVRYARRLLKSGKILFPDGTTEAL